MLLIIPSKPDSERDAVAREWELRGQAVLRLDRFWEIPENVDRSAAKLYGNDTFCLVVAQKLNLTLLAPDDRIIASAPSGLVRRTVALQSLSDLESSNFPLFVKPATPKQFRGAVYQSFDALQLECKGLHGSTDVLVSEVVEFKAEARSFVLDGVIQTCSVYEGRGNADHAATFSERVVMALELPRTCVVDVGMLADGTWALIELNSTWGAGLNGCDPSRVVDCIAAATVKK